MIQYTDPELADILEKRIGAFYRQIEQYQGLLASLVKRDGEHTPSFNTVIHNNNTKEKKPYTIGVVPSNEWFLKQLEDGKPKTTKQLLDNFNSENNLAYEIAKMSQYIMNKTEKGLLKRYEIIGAIKAKKYWYGLPEWFDGEQLRPQYLDKIKALL